MPTLVRRALYERFFVDELRLADNRTKGRKAERRVVARTTHEKAVQGIVRMMVEGAGRKDGARLIVHLDERISGRIPAEIEGPPQMPPFLLLIGANGGQVALGYAPQGVVPGMESFMPREVKALPAGNGHKNGKGKTLAR